ncbi:hypothetical protein AYO38_09200 [bacterium SCGC AG-212-C10]|nr:hypothetical protein AYO38_09200 [bacterium SCGC AG-212-C10]
MGERKLGVSNFRGALWAAAWLAIVLFIGRQYSTASGQQPPIDVPDVGLFRVVLQLDRETDVARVQSTGAAISEQDDALRLVVIADGDQLEALTRLGFLPVSADALDSLIKGASARLPLADSSLSAAFQALSAAGSPTTAWAALSADVQALVVQATSVDDDGDGLTNTQEAWWCTNVGNPDSDGDGSNDGAEVLALKRWLQNTAARPSNGTPFVQWPFPIDGQNPNCPDGDRDSVPTLARTLGSRLKSE